MTQIPSVPTMRKGALISGISVIPFQYTPEKLVRSLSPNGVTSGVSEVMRIKGPPHETIDLSLLVDATDQMERGQGLLSGLGIYPSLSALENLLYPNPAVVLANAVLTNLGVIEIIPAEPLLTVLVWGVMRIVPVQVTSLEISEEQFDSALVPIRANVGVKMKVLTYSDLGLLSVGGMLSYANHVEKQALTLLSSSASAGAAVGAIGGIDWSVVGSAMSSLV